MKKLFLFALLCVSLCAEEDYSQYSYWDFHPLHAGAAGIVIGKAEVDPKRQSHDGDLTFNKASLFTYILLPISKCSYFFPRIEWNTFHLDWNRNPKFKQTRFQYMQFALTFFSIALDKWRWIARGEYNIDVDHFSHARTYGLFSALLWGTHELNNHSHIHLGAFGYTGFEGEMVYPVIGFDYSYKEKWFFQAVFPITYSIEYILNKEWRLCLKGRPLRERFRTGPDEPQPRSVFNYSSIGTEFNVHYEKFLRCELEFFAGYNFGGNFYIKNRDGKFPLYTNVHGAPYAGANFNYGF